MSGDVERQALLARRIRPFLLRRTKQEVAPELPARTEIAETIKLGEAQRAIYEGIRLAMHARVRRHRQARSRRAGHHHLRRVAQAALAGC